MRILIISPYFRGGLNHYISQLSNALAKKESVTVIAPFGVHGTSFSPDVKVIEAPIGNTMGAVANSIIPTKALELKKIVEQENPDIIHINSVEPSLWAFLLSVRHYPKIATIHDLNPHPGSLKVLLGGIVGTRLHIQLCDAFIVHCKVSTNDLNTKKPVFVIPHGDYSFLVSNVGTPATEENAVLFFGRIVEYKGLNYLIEAMELVQRKIPDAKLIVAGSGNIDKYTASLNRINSEVHNRYVSDSEIPGFFQRSKLVALPYIEGTQTGVVPIAYAFKKPVVVTDVGCIPEVVDDGVTGFVVPPQDPMALTEAITKLLETDAKRKAMGEKAYEKMQRELSWTEIARRTVETYQEVIDARRKSG
jgi:alpha-maltose-1-phosphate synthase